MRDTKIIPQWADACDEVRAIHHSGILTVAHIAVNNAPEETLVKFMLVGKRLEAMAHYRSAGVTIIGPDDFKIVFTRPRNNMDPVLYRVLHWQGDFAHIFHVATIIKLRSE